MTDDRIGSRFTAHSSQIENVAFTMNNPTINDET